ncbi:MAG TPA: hypothetical protein VHP62_01755 [Usitatibacter sp.]|jgi:hypothetical protein|nr:hypothetical protein [Usitatibacter sp.]
MAQQELLDIVTEEFITALVDRGILPAGTTKGPVWAGNVSGVSHIKIYLNNTSFDDLTPVPVSAVNVPAAIEALGL